MGTETYGSLTAVFTVVGFSSGLSRGRKVRGVGEVKREMKKFVDILSWVSPEYVFTSTLTNTEYSKERNAKKHGSSLRDFIIQ